MNFAIQGLDHVVLRVADVERALRFYCEVLGCREERRLESIGLVQLRAGAALIDLVPTEGTPETGGGNMDHFCLRIERGPRRRGRRGGAALRRRRPRPLALPPGPGR